MSAAPCEEPAILEIAGFAAPDAVAADPAELELRRVDVMAANWEASAVSAGDLAAFLELLTEADPEYLETADRQVPEASFPVVDWDTVSDALGESQRILVSVQSLLGEILEGMGVADGRYLRVAPGADGCLRLTSGHPRREEIEAALNGPENRHFRELHAAALAGLGLAGGLVGSLSAPPALLAASVGAA